MEINEFINQLKLINIDISQEQLNQLQIYYQMLKEENEKLNLTAIIEEKDVYLKHFYDSLTLSKIIDLKNVETFCDIGTGAGFPGLVIKILFPNMKVTLIDSLNKRLDFINKVVEKLNLKDIELVHARIEEYGIKNREKFDLVTARAVTNLNNLLEFSIPITKVNGYFVAMKANVDEEINTIDSAKKKLKCDIEKIEKFNLPIENSQRTLIKFIKNEKTEKQYPRRFSIIKQKPL